MLPHRGRAAGSARYPGVPRRPARHGDHLGRRPDQRLPHHRAQARGHQAGALRRRSRPSSSSADEEGDGRALELRRRRQRSVIYRGRTTSMNQWKSAHAVDTDARTLEDAMKGADVFIGLSVKGALTQEMVKSMVAQADHLRHGQSRSRSRRRTRWPCGRTPSSPPATRTIRTGQQRAGLSLHLPRRARRARAQRVNHEMKIACAQALAELAREDVPDEVAAAYRGDR